MNATLREQAEAAIVAMREAGQAETPDRRAYERAALNLLRVAVRIALNPPGESILELPTPTAVTEALWRFADAPSVLERMAALRDAVDGIAQALAASIVPRELWLDPVFATAAAGVVRGELLNHLIGGPHVAAVDTLPNGESRSCWEERAKFN